MQSASVISFLEQFSNMFEYISNIFEHDAYSFDPVLSIESGLRGAEFRM